MRTVTKENLIAQIDRLRKIKDEQGQLSMSGEYTLQAYEMLLATMEADPVAYSLIFRNMDGVLNNYINTNTVFATREKAEAYGKGGNYEVRSDGGLEWVPNTALDPVVIPLYRHAQQPVAVTDDELNAALQLHRLKVDGHSQLSDAFRAGFRYARRTAPQPAPVVPEALENLRSIVADPRLLPRRKEWISGQQYSYVLLEEVEAIVDDACRAAMLNK